MDEGRDRASSRGFRPEVPRFDRTDRWSELDSSSRATKLRPCDKDPPAGPVFRYNGTDNDHREGLSPAVSLTYIHRGILLEETGLCLPKTPNAARSLEFWEGRS